MLHPAHYRLRLIAEPARPAGTFESLREVVTCASLLAWPSQVNSARQSGRADSPAGPLRVPVGIVISL